MKRKGIVKYLIFRTLGNFFVLFTIYGFFATFGPAIYYEALFRWSRVAGISYSVVETNETTPLGQLLRERQIGTTSNQPSGSNDSLLGAILSGEKQHVLIPTSAEFSIAIPKIGANARVLTNVDPSNEKEYLSALQKGVAHAKGSAFPGLKGNIYLFAHSADNFWNVGRYNAVFYLLKELENGDDITVFFNGTRYDYDVSDKQVVDASDISHITSNIGQGEKLILQTCWPPGTAWKRLLVFARPKS